VAAVDEQSQSKVKFDQNQCRNTKIVRCHTNCMRKVFVEKLMVAPLLKKCPALYGMRRIITMFTRARQWPLYEKTKFNYLENARIKKSIFNMKSIPLSSTTFVLNIFPSHKYSVSYTRNRRREKGRSSCKVSVFVRGFNQNCNVQQMLINPLMLNFTKICSVVLELLHTVEIDKEIQTDRDGEANKSIFATYCCKRAKKERMWYHASFSD
jgi:hypothetical protein